MSQRGSIKGTYFPDRRDYYDITHVQYDTPHVAAMAYCWLHSRLATISGRFRMPTQVRHTIVYANGTNTSVRTFFWC